jgi:N-acetylglucosamine-6-phosphate deacetylase
MARRALLPMTRPRPSHATAFVNARLVLSDGLAEGALVAREGRIELVGPRVSPPSGAEVTDLAGRYLAPGFIDIHVHGGGGHNLMTDDAAEIEAYARWVVSRGVTSFLVSTSGPDHADIVRRLQACLSALRPLPGAAEAVCFHLEGPFLNPKRKGAFPEGWLRLPSAREFEEYARAADGRIRQVTLAPELPGADELIAEVRRLGTVPAIGHSDATYDEATRAFELGVSHATHCFNAMRPFLHRDPGCLGAILTSPRVTAELIADGSHVHPAAAALLVRAKGVERTVLVTDGIPLAGLDHVDEGAWGETVRVEGSVIVRADGVIAGSVATLDELVRNACAWLGADLPEAVCMASLNPARVIGLDGAKGALRPGLDADLVVLDGELRVVEAYVAGERAFPALR